jgi:hypothetical protein
MDYARLITSVNEAARLRNLDSGETMDPSEKIKAMAARVGLGLPKVRITTSQQLILFEIFTRFELIIALILFNNSFIY